MRTATLFTLVLIVMIGYALRVLALGESAIWWDEAWSVWVAQQPFGEATRLTAADVHPPLYQWALHGWVRLAGIEPFAVRYLSLLWGMLTITLAWALGARLAGDRRAGLIAALLVACSPFFVRWSQETRMYAQSAALTALTAYAYLRVTTARGAPARGWWLALIAGGVGGALTHYLGALTLALVNLHWLAGALRRPRASRFRGWAGAMTVSAGLLGLWALYAAPLTRSGSVPNDADPAFVFQLAGALWSVGTSLNVADYAGVALGWALVALAGLVLAARRRAGAVGLIALFALVPPLMIYGLGVLQTRFYSPKPEERYLVIFAPLVFAGWGLALAALARWRRGIGGMALLAALAVFIVMGARLGEARYLRDDYYALFDALHALARPDEPVLFVSDDRYPLAFYHLNRAAGWQSPLTVRGIPAPQGDRADADAIRALIGESARFWVVRIEQNLRDPHHLTTAWIDTNYPRILAQAVDYNGYALYATDPADDLTPPISQAVVVSPIRQARPGDLIFAGGQDARVALRHAGQVIAQATTTGWGLVGLPVYGAYPPGVYELAVGDAPSRTLTIHGTAGHAEPRTPITADFGALALAGVSVDPPAVPPGGTFTITLHWRVIAPPPVDYTVFAQLLGPFTEAGIVWASDDGYPAGTPTSALWAGAMFDDVRRLTVPPHMPPGVYEAIFGLYRLETGERLLTADGADAVTVPGLVVTGGV